MEPKVGIIGVGMVGTPIARYFQEIKNYKRWRDLFLYDTDTRKNYVDDISKADIVFVCLPTPRNSKDGSCDTSIVEEAVARIGSGSSSLRGGTTKQSHEIAARHASLAASLRSARVARNDGKETVASNGTGKIIVIKSTVPPGTTKRFQKKYPKHKFLFNPEFLTESRAWEDMLRPDRQIVGFTDESLDAAHLVLSLLPKAPFMSPWGTGTYYQTRITATEAEFIKYAGNVYFVRKINWANALARAAEKLGVNYENIRKGMSADHRIGDSHLDVNHGGYRGSGGFCFPKDAAAFMAFAKQKGLDDVHALLMSDWKFNENLLAEQGLTVDDVSRHITETELFKIKNQK